MYRTRLANFCRHRDLGGTTDPTANKVNLYNWLAQFSKSFPLPPEKADEELMTAYRELDRHRGRGPFQVAGWI